MTKILLVEDDERIVDFLRRGLKAEGFIVDVAVNGEDALQLCHDHDYPLVILDVMLPTVSGIEVCKTLRRENKQSLVLMLTAKDSVQDKIEGLHGGADDYLTKPFAFDELLARIAALLRRRPYSDPGGVMSVGDLVLDAATRSARRGTRQIELTAKEFAVLQFMMENAGRVLSRSRILSNVWEHNSETYTNVVDVYVRYLRRKVDHDGETPLIRTVRGAGYMISH
ncbi:response regulator transcription factor [Dongia deserti]|uniref:response regulator transcription factor n=1 Tax=Dongia deserti TaxID=2268030 RepID=UPI000E64915B|nr:response regulator transcription factor [Dongia deserti]